ncbi:deoxyribose-p aldolase [Lactobacillus helveticus MTCC 5463]|nr:deoxyribose-p aldolase [Lactobacillus helveticus MTCC 5463]
MVRAGADRIGCSAGVKTYEALKRRMEDDHVDGIEINR